MDKVIFIYKRKFDADISLIFDNKSHMLRYLFVNYWWYNININGDTVIIKETENSEEIEIEIIYATQI